MELFQIRELAKSEREAYFLHSKFWAANNERFEVALGEFQKRKDLRLFDPSVTDNPLLEFRAQGMQPSEQDWSLFYRQFLDRNWNQYRDYNAVWWRTNLSLLYAQVKGLLSRLCP